MEVINLVAELERLKATTRDVVLPTQLIRAVEDGGTVKLDLKEHGRLPLTHHGENQLAEKTGVPSLYVDKMKKAGLTGLAVQNYNGWLETQKDNRLVRIADNRVRAILSDRYRTLDNFDVAILAMQKARQYGASADRCELTETRMYIRFLMPGKKEDIRPGDAGIPGLQISNSEVGAGAFRVEPFLYRVICANGVIAPDNLYKIHIGGRLDVGEVFTDKTLQQIDTALMSQVRDIVDSTFSNQETVQRLFKELRGLAEIPIGKPKEVVDVVVKDLNLSDEAKVDLLRYFAKEGDTAFGLVNGITRLAQDRNSFDERVDFERYAGDLTMDPAKLEKILVAAK